MAKKTKLNKEFPTTKDMKAWAKKSPTFAAELARIKARGF